MGRNDERAGHVRKLRDIARAAQVEYVSKDLALRVHGQGLGGWRQGLAGGRVEGGGRGTEGGQGRAGARGRAGPGGGGRARHLLTSFRLVGRYTWNCTAPLLKLLPIHFKCFFVFFTALPFRSGGPGTTSKQSSHWAGRLCPPLLSFNIITLQTGRVRKKAVCYRKNWVRVNVRRPNTSPQKKNESATPNKTLANIGQYGSETESATVRNSPRQSERVTNVSDGPH